MCFMKRAHARKGCLRVDVWPASALGARQRCINSKRHVLRQRVAHAKVVVVVARREKETNSSASRNLSMREACSRRDRGRYL